MSTLHPDHTWDGTLKGCLGKDCPTCCCHVKHIHCDNGKDELIVTLDKPSVLNDIEVPFTLEGPTHPYRTMMHPQEAVMIRDHAKTDVTITPVKTVNNITPDGEVVIGISLLLNDCLGETGCKIPGLKPLVCKMFPFFHDASDIEPQEDTVDVLRCPAALEIAMDEENVKNILGLRKRSGYTDNKTYLEQLIITLERYGQKPERKFLQDEDFMKQL